MLLAACGATDEGSRAGSGATTRIPGPHATRAVVWALGDAATPTRAARRMAAMVRRARPDLFLYLGDVYENGTAQEFSSHYDPLFGSLAGRTMPTPGNHEWPNRATGYFPYWAQKKGHRQPPWTKRTIAGWQILDLNSQAPHSDGSPQTAWLDRVLANGTGTCRIAFWHRPRYSRAGYSDAPDLDPLWRRLIGHARVVLSGHDHNLQRHRPIQGLVEYVVGAAGRGRYPLRQGDPTAVWRRDDVNAALRIVLKPGRALLEFRTASGRVLDRSRVSCKPVVAG
jgi:hypothetical protein